MENLMELGAYSFGDTQRNADGSLRSTAEAIGNLFEAITVADDVGLDYFGIGEHHTLEMPASSPGTLIAALGSSRRWNQPWTPSRPNASPMNRIRNARIGLKHSTTGTGSMHSP